MKCHGIESRSYRRLIGIYYIDRGHKLSILCQVLFLPRHEPEANRGDCG